MRLTALSVYPIKSAAGIPADVWQVDEFGLRFDRRWMVIDEAGRFISQREQPRLALVRPSFHEDLLLVDAPGQRPLELPLHSTCSVTTKVTVWHDTCEVNWLGDHAAAWFSAALGCSCSLVYMADSTVRPADPRFATSNTRVSFADAFPFLMISEESLAELNSRMPVPLPMNRFRPNLVIAGGDPYVEDSLDRFTIGEIGFRAVKPCDRCVIPTTDQSTAERGHEPLRTLATYRRRDGQVFFGQNLVHSGSGRLSVGDLLQL
jgi:MOSC domain-containing protein